MANNFGKWMSNYVRSIDSLSGQEELELKAALEYAGYKVTHRPSQNPWMLLAIETKDGRQGGVYVNSRAEMSMPAEIKEILDNEVRRPDDCTHGHIRCPICWKGIEDELERMRERYDECYVDKLRLEATVKRLQTTPSGAAHLSFDVLMKEASKIGPLEDEVERLRAALKKIVDNSGSQSIEAQTAIAREALGDDELDD